MSYDPVARIYRVLEVLTFGGALQRARVAFVDQARDARRALVVGEGDGRFLAELVQRFPLLRVDCVDASAAMLELARSRLGALATNVRFVRADLVGWAPPGDEYDLIVTHFILDCFDAAALASIVRKLGAAAAPRSTWLVADFTLPARGWRRLLARAWLWTMYLFFGIATGMRTRALIDPEPLLLEAGYVRQFERTTRQGMLRSASWHREGVQPVDGSRVTVQQASSGTT